MLGIVALDRVSMAMLRVPPPVGVGWGGAAPGIVDHGDETRGGSGSKVKMDAMFPMLVCFGYKVKWWRWRSGLINSPVPNYNEI